MFILNRDLQKPRDVDITWRDLTPAEVDSWQTIMGNDLKAVNTFEQPNRIAPQSLDAPKVGPGMTFQVPARSYNVMSLGI